MAGVRKGDRIAVLGAGARVVRALLAASGSSSTVVEAADVAIAGAAYEVPTAVLQLRPGGRLVAVAADAGAAARVAAAYGLGLRYVERVGHRVVWSAVTPLGPDAAA